MNKRKLILYILAAVVGLFVMGVLVTASIWPVINDVETGKTPEYPDVQPQYYTADPARVFDEARASVEALPKWTVAASDATTGAVQAERTTRTMGFIDDVMISVQPVTEFAVQVNVRSTSRVGKGDFGQNARNIHEFFAELDSRLGAVKFEPGGSQKDSDESADDAPKAK